VIVLPCAAADAPRRYALAELLRGLGLAPAWVRPADAALYAGPDPESAPATALRFRTVGVPDGLPEASNLGCLVHDGRDTPLPVGPSGTPEEGPHGVVEADVLGSAFWWLAGVQESATVARDAHGRFRFADSLQHGLGLGARAPVDELRAWLGAALRALGHDVPGRTWAGAPWAIALTHDLDAVRTPRLRAAAAELLRGRPRRALARGLGPDARRASIDALAALARRHGARSTLFVKTVGRGSPEDVPYHLGPALAQHLSSLAADGFEVGLHPGYATHDHAGRLAAERDRLAHALGEAPHSVRSHFLRWHAPTTPRLYRAAGFTRDSTLGWSDAPGFRRGTAHPFRLWDRSAGQPTDLWEWPLAAMDTALFTHLGLSDDAAAERLAGVFAEARRGGGCAVVLWHSAMDADPAWTRRLGVLDAALAQARADGAAVGSLAGLARRWGAG
jgi:hypothetical protein